MKKNINIIWFTFAGWKNIGIYTKVWVFLRWQKVFSFHLAKILKDLDANLNKNKNLITARTNPPLFHSEDDYQVEQAMKNQSGNEGMFLYLQYVFTI
jgi:hypothetical protein